MRAALTAASFHPVTQVLVPDAELADHIVDRAPGGQHQINGIPLETPA